MIEALHLRSSIRHLKANFGKNQIASRFIIPWPRYAKTSFFETGLWHSDNFGLKNPVIQKTVLRKCATSLVERQAWCGYAAKDVVYSKARTRC